jgi:pantothenate kinase type III
MNSSKSFLEQTLAIDFGNSRMKILCGKDFKAIRYNKNYLENFKKYFYQKVQKPVRILYSSVNERNSNEVINFLVSQPDVYIYNIKDLISKQRKVNINNYFWVGTDRILGLISAAEEFGAPVLTVDFGTAVTINCIDENRNLLGGVIFPGIELQLKSLQENTFFLKNVQLKKEPSEKVIEINTEMAISSGIINSVWGGVAYIIDTIKREVFEGRNIPVIFTGGGFEYIRPKFEQWEYEKKYFRKNLVLEGILVLARSIKQYLIGFESK